MRSRVRLRGQSVRPFSASSTSPWQEGHGNSMGGGAVSLRRRPGYVLHAWGGGENVCWGGRRKAEGIQYVETIVNGNEICLHFGCVILIFCLDFSRTKNAQLSTLFFFFGFFLTFGWHHMRHHQPSRDLSKHKRIWVHVLICRRLFSWCSFQK